jgi:hypothetical protein
LLILGYRLVALLVGFILSIVFAGIFYGILDKIDPFGVKLTM